jgi:hypothetical protein
MVVYTCTSAICFMNGCINIPLQNHICVFVVFTSAELVLCDGCIISSSAKLFLCKGCINNNSAIYHLTV